MILKSKAIVTKSQQLSERRDVLKIKILVKLTDPIDGSRAIENLLNPE